MKRSFSKTTKIAFVVLFLIVVAAVVFGRSALRLLNGAFKSDGAMEVARDVSK
jgi:hypothetical protein